MTTGKDKSVFASDATAKVGLSRNQGRVGRNYVPASKTQEAIESNTPNVTAESIEKEAEAIRGETMAGILETTAPTEVAAQSVLSEKKDTHMEPIEGERTKSALKYQIRFTGDTRNKLDALIAVGNLQGKQYEIIDTIIDGYIEEKLSDKERELLSLLIETRKDSYID